MNAERLNAFRLQWSRAGLTVLTLAILAAQARADGEPAEKKKDAPPPRELPRYLVRPGATAGTALNWRNGERLPGSPASADGSTVEWETALFTAPIPVKSEVIRRIDFDSKFVRPEGSFRLVLTDGSHLTGDLEKVEEQSLTFKAAGLGPLIIKRDAIVCLERISGPGITAAGPLAMLPEKPAGATGDRSPSPLLFAAGGQTATPAFNLVNQRELTLPDKCLVEILLRSDAAPDFRLTAARDKDAVTVETWGDELVLLQEKRFASAGMKIGEKDRTVHLRLGWDRAAGRCALYGADGALWVELLPEKPVDAAAAGGDSKSTGSWLRRLFGKEDRPASQSPRRQAPGKGIQLINKGSGVVVERFSVSEWDGNPPPALGSGAPSVETAAEVIAGEPSATNGPALVVRKADGSTQEVPMDSVRAIRWPRVPRMERNNEESTLWFSSGNLLRGKLREIKEEHASMETAFSAEPVRTPLKGCLSLTFPGESKKSGTAELEKLDVISAGTSSLHGTIHSGGGVLPYFQPVGSDAAVMPAPAKELTMTRHVPKGAAFERAPALLHLKSNETLPATLKSVSRDRIAFAWDATATSEIETSSVHAVQFSAPAAGTTGFDAPGWQMTGTGGKAPARKGSAIVLKPGSGIGHSYLLQGGEISFRMARDSGLSSMRIRLFCQGTAADSSSVNFLLGDFGSEVYCGVEQGEGQMENQTEMPNDRTGNRIRLTFSGDDVQLYVNNSLACTTSIKGRTGKKTGSGIILETASLWGNQMGSVRLFDFAMQTSPTMAPPPPYTEDARHEALLLPRMRRDDPPHHILIGRNGDLLRGEIESMTETHLAFRAGLENFKVPLDRVAAAVWVQKPDKSPAGKSGEEKKEPSGVITSGKTPKYAEVKAEPAAGSVQWLDLTNGGRIALAVDSWADGKVAGTHAVLGHCEIPDSLVHRLSLKAMPATGALAALANWKLEHTADPVIPGGEEESSPLSGKEAADFSLPMVEGEKFALSQAKGKVVVLDFWATWCGPCVKSLPGLVEAMAAFPAEKVIFLAVNQGETKEQVEKFLTARGLKMSVALDADQGVAKKYGVDGIPHTVVIGRDGKVALVKTGYEPEGEKKIAEAVTKALEGGATGPEPTPSDKPEEKKSESAAEEPLLPAPKPAE